jgi:hypothetical protein
MLDPEVHELLVAYVAQEEHLVAVTDEYKCVMRDFELVH